MTPQREATLLVLLENEKDHLSAEEIFFLCAKSPEIGLATVYRTLEILTDLKIVDKVSFNDGVLVTICAKKEQSISITICFV